MTKNVRIVLNISCCALAVVLAFSAATAPTFAQTVTGWRSDGSGSYPNANPPLQWSKSKNVVWATPLPESNSIPVVTDDRIFVCAEPFTLLCLSKDDGKILWRHEHDYRQLHSDAEWAKIEAELQKVKKLRERQRQIERKIGNIRRELRKKADPKLEVEKNQLEEQVKLLIDDEKKFPLALQWETPRTHGGLNGYSTPTPVSDGRHVWALFGNGVAACYDKNGKRLWMKLIDRPSTNFGQSSSPLLVDGLVLFLINDLVALNAMSSEVQWRAKSDRAWGTSMLVNINGRPVILTPRGEFIGTNDGSVLSKNRQFRLSYTSPVVAGGKAFFIDAFSRAMELPTAFKDDEPAKKLWAQRIASGRYFSSPIVHDGLVYTVSDGKMLTVLDAGTGEVVYEKELPLPKDRIFSSITLAGKHLFVCSSRGVTLVLKTGRAYEEVTRNELEPTRSSPVFVGGRMYLRTREHLYCIGEQK